MKVSFLEISPGSGHYQLLLDLEEEDPRIPGLPHRYREEVRIAQNLREEHSEALVVAAALRSATRRLYNSVLENVPS